MAGGVFAGIQTTIGPSIFSLTLLLFLLSMIVVGGRGSNWGPIIGAGALMLADTVLRDFDLPILDSNKFSDISINLFEQATRSWI